jgi:hypothetical protein
MHCFSCNCVLSDYEATRKVSLKGGGVYYPDLCIECIGEAKLVGSISSNNAEKSSGLSAGDADVPLFDKSAP